MPWYYKGGAAARVLLAVYVFVQMVFMVLSPTSDIQGVSQDTWPAPVALAGPGYCTPGDLAGMLQAKAHLAVSGG